jgi:hypothetical protein
VTPVGVGATAVGLPVTGEAGDTDVAGGSGNRAVASGLACCDSGPFSMAGASGVGSVAGTVAADVGATVGTERVETAVWVASKPGVSW